MVKKLLKVALAIGLLYVWMQACASMFRVERISPQEQARIDEIWRCRQDPGYKSDEQCAALYQPRDTEPYLRRWKR